MIRLHIQSNKHGQMFKDFNSQAEVDEYLSEIGDHWGRKQEDIIVVQSEIQDEQGNIVQPQITEVLPQEVVFTTEDKTAEYEQEKQKKDKKKKDREDRVMSLKNIDWTKVDKIADLKQIVKALVNESLKDEE